MKIIHNFLIMLARTTIALEDDIISNLKKIAQERRIRSLSALIKEVLLSYIDQIHKKRLYQKMANDYQNYAENVYKEDWKLFKEMESAALEDLNQRKL